MNIKKITARNKGSWYSITMEHQSLGGLLLCFSYLLQSHGYKELLRRATVLHVITHKSSKPENGRENLCMFI